MESGPEKRFQQPVSVALAKGETVVVDNTRQATDLLLSEWPARRGPRHRDAVEACLKVLDGHRSTVDARNALIEAAQEAGILADETSAPGGSS
jgi:hypothetical protein